MQYPSLRDLLKQQLSHGDSSDSGEDDLTLIDEVLSDSPAAPRPLDKSEVPARPPAPAPVRREPAAREPAPPPAHSPTRPAASAPAPRRSDAPPSAKNSSGRLAQAAPPPPRRAEPRSAREDLPPAPRPEPVKPPGHVEADALPSVETEDGTLGLRDVVAHEPSVRKERGEGRLPEGFARLGLPETVLRGLRHAGYESPTAIQEIAIPEILAGKDVIGQAKTGTGKTAAFGLPILARIVPGAGTQALILAPTRELALQVRDEIEKLGRYTTVRSAAIYGGVPLDGQERALREGRELLVGTPGRVLDHVRRRSLDLSKLRIVVLDECDRMFDLGFRPDIERVMRAATGREQLLLFSATVGGDVLKLAEQHTKDPVCLYTAPETLTVDGVTQNFCTVAKDRKVDALVALIKHDNPTQAIVFCRTKIGCEKTTKRIRDRGVPVEEMHGDLRQSARERILKCVRDGSVRVLVATNIAARGLDIPTISHIYNYDCPDFAEDYVHRIGRTARNGAVGTATTLVEPGQGGLITDIEKLINVEVKERTIPNFDPGSMKAPDAPTKPRPTGTGEILFSSWQPRS